MIVVPTWCPIIPGRASLAGFRSDQTGRFLVEDCESTTGKRGFDSRRLHYLTVEIIWHSSMRDAGNRRWCPPGAHSFVYFIQCGPSGGPIKVGRAANAEQRLLDLQVGCPFDLTLLASILVDDAEKLEADLHARFSAFRIRGEWFEGCYALRSAAVQVAKLASRQSDQLKTSGDAVFEWRGVARESVEMPDTEILTTSAVGSRVADPRKLRTRAVGFMWRGKWRL